MGLDISHGAWSGSYCSFDRFRCAVAKACGGSFPPHADPNLDPAYWYIDSEFQEPKGGPKWGPDGELAWKWSGLFELLNHPDHTGWISSTVCAVLARNLRDLREKIEANLRVVGHIKSDTLTRFIAGCELAAEREEELVFS